MVNISVSRLPFRCMSALSVLVSGAFGLACQGETFSANDRCKTGSCLPDGEVACTEKACPAQDAGPRPNAAQPCDFSARYTYGYIGGFQLHARHSDLAPGNKYTHTSAPLLHRGPTLTCSPPMPPCGSQDVITAYDIEVHDLGQADVQAALAEPQRPLFGYDERPVDGVVFELKRDDGRGFLVGAPCNGRTGSCRPIPPGVAQLVKRLLDLDKQQLAAPSCQALRER